MGAEGFAVSSILSKIMTDIHTESDNTTFDHGRVFCSLSYLAYIVYAMVSVIMNHPWDAMSFAGGLMAITVGHGINSKLRNDTEPQGQP